MDDPSLILQVVFYQSENNKEPVREWLKSLSQGEKKLIGEAIKTVQFSGSTELVLQKTQNQWQD
jgi:hypothetical protein